MALSTLESYPLPLFDEFRTDIQNALSHYDKIIQDLKKEIEKTDNASKIFLYLYQALFSIIQGEKKYRTGDYNSASSDFSEGEKMLVRFQRLSTNFPPEFKLLTERLRLFSKGRQCESSALNQGVDFKIQFKNLHEAIQFYADEIALLEKEKKTIMLFNAKARYNFVKGLVLNLEGHSFTKNNDLRGAKEKHLSAYRFFTLAAYFNPSYTIWVTEQNNTIMAVMNRIIKEKASKQWNRAYAYINEGKFIESSEACNIASKLYGRASRIANDKKAKMMLQAYSYMFRANMFESKANDFIKNNNDAKGSIHQYELAAEFMEKALNALPKLEDNEELENRWSAQFNYYKGCFYQSQGIYNLDSENYPEALEFFTQANEFFVKGMKKAEQSNDDGLKKLLSKAVAEAKGYIGMCKTVID